MKIFMFMLLLLVTNGAIGQTTGRIIVGGDFDKFYPTIWNDDGWGNNVASQLEIGRPNIHEDSNWRGSMLAKFSYHTYLWGNGAQFIDADVIQNHNQLYAQNLDFIAGWRDLTQNNSSMSIVIWLRGGNTTYFYTSRFPTTPIVYDGIANALPYQEINGPAHTFKTTIDAYVNSNGISKAGTAYFNGNTSNYFAGNVGIGIYDPKDYKLAVNGKIRAQEIKVEATGWPDYVFMEDYKFPSLQETEKHIKEKGHLPGIPSAADVKANGIDLGEMNVKLLQKIEELTLYLIEMKKEMKVLQRKVDNNEETKL